MSQIAHLLQRGVRKTPEKTAIYYQGEKYTYQQLDQLIGRMSYAFRHKLELQSGNVVAIQSSNTIQYVLTLLACWRCGVTLTPLNPALKPEEIRYQLNHSQATLYIFEDQVREKVEAVRGELHTVQRFYLFDGVAAGEFHPFSALFGEGYLPPEEVDEELNALLIYTSGTTGKPKGVQLTHRNVTAMITMLIETLSLTAEDRALLILPLFHVNAIMCTLGAPLLHGGSVILHRRFNLDRFLEDIDRYRPTYTSAVPTIYQMLLDLPEGTEERIDFSSLRFGICGGAPIAREVFLRFEERYPIKLLEGWGLSEGSMASTFNPLHGKRKIGSIGLPMNGQQVLVVDETGKALPPGQKGELIVKGENVMAGYLHNPKETAKTVKDGWLYTGDIGYKDEEGYIYLVDRKKDLIIRGGMNIYPKEIEEVLYQLPQVKEAAVIGVPDERYGEEVKAFIVLQEGAELSDDEVIAHCQAHLANYKCPKSVAFLKELPKNAVGKITKHVLRDKYKSANL